MEMDNKELRCPHCNYIRQPKTDEHGLKECPRCGIIYKKYEAYLTREQTKTQIYPEVKEGTDRILKLYLFIRNLFPNLFYRLRQSDTLAWLLSRLKNSLPIQWITWHRDTIASILFKLWIVGFGYWIYRLITVNVASQEYWRLINTATIDAREALTYLFFGFFVCFFLLIFSAFIIKFMYNLIWESIKRRFSYEWHPLLTSVALLSLLLFSFAAIGKIKVTGLSAYHQAVEIAHAAKQHKIILRSKPQMLPEMDID